MKTHRLFIPILTGLCSAALFCACSDSKDPVPDKTPEPPTPEALVNAYEYDGVKSEIASVVQEWINGAEYVILSPEKNISGADKLIGSDKEHVMFVFKDGIDTKETDLAVEGVDVYYYGSGGKLLFKATGTNRSDITAGTLKGSNIDKENAVFDFSITQVSEVIFRGNFTASLAVERPREPKNWVAFGEEKREMKSVFVESVGDYKIMNMTPAEGVTSFEQIMDNDYDCFQVTLAPELLNTSFDVITEVGDFEIISMFQDSEVMIESGSAEGVESGTCLFSIEGTTATISVNLVLEDGSTLSAEGSCEVEPEQEPTEYIAVNGTKKAVGAAFIELGLNSYILYFTPDQIDYFSQLPETEYAFALEFGFDLADGIRRDITALTNEPFSFEYTNFAEETDARIATGELNGATGTLSVKQNDEQEEIFTIELHLVLTDGTKFDLKFDDACVPFDEEEAANEYIFNGNANPINSVIVDQSNADLYDIWLCGARGITTIDEMQQFSAIKISCPAICFDGRTALFSDFPDTVKVEFGPFTFNGAAGNMGSVTALLDGTNLTLDFKAEDTLSGHYVGSVLIK